MTAKNDVFSREEVSSLYLALAERDAQIASLNEDVYEKDDYINSLSQILTERDGQIQDVESVLNLIKNSRVWRLAEFFRCLVYQKILGPFPLLQQAALTISRAGFSAYYHKAKRRLKKYLWRLNDVPSASETSPSEAAPLKTMEAKTYVRLSDFQMKAGREVIRRKLRAINAKIGLLAKKYG